MMQPLIDKLQNTAELARTVNSLPEPKKVLKEYDNPATRNLVDNIVRYCPRLRVRVRSLYTPLWQKLMEFMPWRLKSLLQAADERRVSPLDYAHDTPSCETAPERCTCGAKYHFS